MILHIFSCAYLDLRIFFGELSNQIFWPLHFKKQSGCLFLLSCKNSLYILDISPLSDICMTNIFSQTVAWLFISTVLTEHMFQILMLSTSSIFVFYGVCFFRCYLRNLSSGQGCKDTLLCFFPGRLQFWLLHFGLWSILHVWLQFYFLREGSSNLPSWVRFPFIHSVQVTRSM